MAKERRESIFRGVFGEIRTTHVTGLVTDLGIELGKLIYLNRLPGEKKVLANRRKLRLHLTLVSSFFIGGLMGAVGFKLLGYVSTVALAALLLALIARPILLDIRAKTLKVAKSAKSASSASSASSKR